MTSNCGFLLGFAVFSLGCAPTSDRSPQPTRSDATEDPGFDASRIALLKGSYGRLRGLDFNLFDHDHDHDAEEDDTDTSTDAATDDSDDSDDTTDDSTDASDEASDDGESGCASGTDCMPDFVWPLNGTDTPDDPLSDTYGPRLLSGTYDFHRGLDLPVDSGSPVYAVAAGTARLAGESSGYNEPVVQLKHEDENGDTFYTNYMHLTEAAIDIGDEVEAGDLVGYSGEPESGFEHLHFEIRRDHYNKHYANHPLRWLPYPDDGGPELEIEDVTVSSGASEVTIRVAAPHAQVDVTLVEVELTGVADGEVVMTDSKTYDLEEWNYLYTESGDVDEADFNGVSVDLDDFTKSTPYYELFITFEDLEGLSEGELEVTVRAEDASGNVTTVTDSVSR